MRTRSKIKSMQYQNDKSAKSSIYEVNSTKISPNSSYYTNNSHVFDDLSEKETKKVDTLKIISKNYQKDFSSLNSTKAQSANYIKELYNNPEFVEVLRGFKDFIEEINKTKDIIPNTHIKSKLIGCHKKANKVKEESVPLKKKLKVDLQPKTKESQIVSTETLAPTADLEKVDDQSPSVPYEENKKDQATVNYNTTEQYSNQNSTIINPSNNDDPQQSQKFLANTNIEPAIINDAYEQQKLAEQYNYLLGRNITRQNLSLPGMGFPANGNISTATTANMNNNSNSHMSYMNFLNDMKYYPNNQLLALKSNLPNNYLEQQIMQAKLKELEYYLARNQNHLSVNDINLLSQLHLNQYYDWYSKYLLTNQLQNPDMINIQNAMELLVAKNMLAAASGGGGATTGTVGGISIIDQLLGKNVYDTQTMRLLNDYSNMNQLLNQAQIYSSPTTAPIIAQTMNIPHLPIVTPVQEVSGRKFPVKRCTYHILIAHTIKQEQLKEKLTQEQKKNHDTIICDSNSKKDIITEQEILNQAQQKKNHQHHNETKNHGSGVPTANIPNGDVIMIVDETDPNVKSLSKENLALLEKSKKYKRSRGNSEQAKSSEFKVRDLDRQNYELQQFHNSSKKAKNDDNNNKPINNHGTARDGKFKRESLNMNGVDDNTSLSSSMNYDHGRSISLQDIYVLNDKDHKSNNMMLNGLNQELYYSHERNSDKTLNLAMQQKESDALIAERIATTSETFQNIGIINNRKEDMLGSNENSNKLVSLNDMKTSKQFNITSGNSEDNQNKPADIRDKSCLKLERENSEKK